MKEGRREENRGKCKNGEDLKEKWKEAKERREERV